MRIPIPTIVIPVAVALVYFFVPGVRERPWNATRIAGAVLAVLGYMLANVARVQLGKSFSVRPRAKDLVTHGLYSRIRHPIYVSVDLMFAGLILVFGWPWLFAVLAVLIVMQVRRALREEQVLHQKFGEVYLDYRRQTWF